jgi:hypothetical protein
MSESDRPEAAEVMDYARRPRPVPKEGRRFLWSVIGWLLAIGAAAGAILVLRWIYAGLFQTMD